MLAKHKYLLTYRYSEIIHDLTVVFIKKYILSNLSILSNLKDSKPDYRTADQMNQSARSGKQNIVEAVGFSRITNFRQVAYSLSALSNLSELGELKVKPKLPDHPESAANFLLTLCHLATYLLNKQLNKAEETFIKEGGYSENLFKKRLKGKIHN